MRPLSASASCAAADGAGAVDAPSTTSSTYTSSSSAWVSCPPPSRKETSKACWTRATARSRASPRTTQRAAHGRAACARQRNGDPGRLSPYSEIAMRYLPPRLGLKATAYVPLPLSVTRARNRTPQPRIATKKWSPPLRRRCPFASRASMKNRPSCRTVTLPSPAPVHTQLLATDGPRSSYSSSASAAGAAAGAFTSSALASCDFRPIESHEVAGSGQPQGSSYLQPRPKVRASNKTLVRPASKALKARFNFAHLT